MPRVLFAVIMSLLVSTDAGAARRRKAVSVSAAAAADKQTFEQTYELVFLQAGQSYLKDEEMPDPAELQPFLAALKEPDLAKAKAKAQSLEDVVSQAECVQKGPQGAPPDVYKLMVDQAADGLETGSIVEQDFQPNARAGRSLDDSEKVLVKACQAEARDQAYDRRSFYKRCLGRRRAEGAYLDLKRPPRPPAPEASAACLRLLDAVAANRPKLSPELSSGLEQRLQATQAGLLAGLGKPQGVPPAPWYSPKTGSGGSPPQRPVPPAGDLTTGLRPVSDLRTGVPPLGTADLGASAQLARIARADEIGFTGYCYSYVKSALQKVGIVDRDTIAKAGLGAHAKEFAAFVEKNPALLKRKLRRVPAPAWPLPIGSIVVWSPGACGYNLKSGHIEIVTRIKPPEACSDGCATFQVACLEELAADPEKAAAELPKAEEELARAQAAADAVKESKVRQARREAAAVLARRRAELAKVRARLEPRAAVYLIERPALPSGFLKP